MSDVAIIMGSDSDWPVMEEAAKALESFCITFTAEVVSAHRMPEEMVEFAKTAATKGYKVIIAGAGGAAHLPGMVAALTPLPVIGVPIPTRHLQGVDSLYSILQMPGGIPVATVAIGNAKNAGLLAVQMLAAHDPILLAKVQEYRQGLKEMVLDKQAQLTQLGYQTYLKNQGKD